MKYSYRYDLSNGRIYFCPLEGRNSAIRDRYQDFRVDKIWWEFPKDLNGKNNFLKHVDPLKSLKLINYRDESFEFLRETPNLQELLLLDYEATVPTFDNLTDLISVKLHYDTLNASNALSLNLKSHFIYSYPEIDFRSIDLPKNLEYLGVYYCPKLKSLSGIEQCPKLKGLDITLAPKISDLDVLNELDQLEELSLSNTPKISSLRGLEELDHLIKLDIEELKKIDSLSPILHLPALETIRLWETKIEDNDVKSVMAHPKLRRFDFDYYKGYNAKSSDFESKPMTKEEEWMYNVSEKAVMALGVAYDEDELPEEMPPDYPQ